MLRGLAMTGGKICGNELAYVPGQPWDIVV